MLPSIFVCKIELRTEKSDTVRRSTCNLVAPIWIEVPALASTGVVIPDDVKVVNLPLNRVKCRAFNNFETTASS
jgi:bifunctional N-acetylglucosamine-1-phosphate-uridyltransferase/glucosamine-1-phosphate-acetyltransferase GlmU-like protein